MLTIGILLFDEVEVLDACGPFEVFSTAARMGADLRVATVAREARPAVARGGLPIVPAHTLGDHPPLDVVLVPGGVTAAVERDPAVLAWVARVRERARITAAVCTGAFILAEAGVLDGRPATTHWEDEDELERRWPAVEVRREPRWVDDGDLVTSAGITAGIDMSLHLVRRLFGADVAVRTARQMEYDWRE
ncbi:MAG TPA: DJ-1/PfpI family protein [Solirubrobacteraceae bacterium]|jgi:transcriptional regulator GlxA family with amidase domain